MNKEEAKKRIENIMEARITILADLPEDELEALPDQRNEAEMQGRFLALDEGKSFGGRHATVDCPICEGKDTLTYSIAYVNGHIHAQCSTKDCVRWME